MRKVVIVGAGGHGREQLDLIGALNAVEPSFEVLGFLIDAQDSSGEVAVRGLPVLGADDWVASHAADVELVCAIGASAARRRGVERLSALGGRFCSLIHPSAVVGPEVRHGEGLLVGANAVVTSDAVLGHHVHVNIGTTVSHDTRIGDYCSLAPGTHLAGSVELAEGVDLGVATTAKPGVRVGSWAISGAGSVLVHDVPAHSTVVGVPARVIAQRSAEGDPEPRS